MRRAVLIIVLAATIAACSFGAAQPAAQTAAAQCADGPPACSADLRAVVQCQGGVVRVLDACSGPRGCGYVGHQIQCDRGGASAPAPAAAQGACAEGGYDCSPDRRSLLACRGGAWAVASSCRGARGCRVGSAVDCDHSVAVAGDPCDGANEIACATDGRQTLRCVSGRYAFGDACPNACLATSGRVLCQ